MGYADIAEALGISRTSVSRLLTKWRKERTLKPKPAGGGNRSPLRDVEREFKALVHEFQDATGEELAALVHERLGVRTSRSAVQRFLVQLGFTLKKRSSSPRSAARLATMRSLSGSAPTLASTSASPAGDDPHRDQSDPHAKQGTRV